MIPACYLLLAGYTACVVAGLFWCFPKRSPTLTDAEREAVEKACDEGRWYPADYHHIHTLRRLLERLG